MGNQTHNQCPTHPDYKLEKMCLCDECLEPLCSVCVREHYKIHDHLGFPPNFVPYEAI